MLCQGLRGVKMICMHIYLYRYIDDQSVYLSLFLSLIHTYMYTHMYIYIYVYMLPPDPPETGFQGSAIKLEALQKGVCP